MPRFRRPPGNLRRPGCHSDGLLYYRQGVVKYEIRSARPTGRLLRGMPRYVGSQVYSCAGDNSRTSADFSLLTWISCFIGFLRNCDLQPGRQRTSITLLAAASCSQRNNCESLWACNDGSRTATGSIANVQLHRPWLVNASSDSRNNQVSQHLRVCSRSTSGFTKPFQHKSDRSELERRVRSW